MCELKRFRITQIANICNICSIVKLSDNVFICVLKFVDLQGFEGKDSGLASVVTLASTLDYRSSKSLLKLLLPLVREMKDIPMNKF